LTISIAQLLHRKTSVSQNTARPSPDDGRAVLRKGIYLNWLVSRRSKNATPWYIKVATTAMMARLIMTSLKLTKDLEKLGVENNAAKLITARFFGVSFCTNGLNQNADDLLLLGGEGFLP
jgi:hypothetical protein